MKLWILIFLFPVCTQAGGYVVGNGGDHCLQEAYNIKVSLLGILRISNPTEFSVETIEKTLNSTSLSCEENLILRGHPVDAINIPDAVAPQIILDKKRFTELRTFSRVKLFFHELLGLLSVDDSSYGVSNKLKDFTVCGKSRFVMGALVQRYKLPCDQISADSLENLDQLSLALNVGDEVLESDFTGLGTLVQLSIHTDNASLTSSFQKAISHLSQLEELTLKLKANSSKNVFNLMELESGSLAVIRLEDKSSSVQWHCEKNPTLKTVLRKDIFYYDPAPIQRDAQGICRVVGY